MLKKRGYDTNQALQNELIDYKKKVGVIIPARKKSGNSEHQKIVGDAEKGISCQPPDDSSGQYGR